MTRGAAPQPTAAFWRDRRVLITGHTGFKGSWLAHWLRRLGAEVHGLALPPQTRPALFDALSLDSRIRHNVQDLRDSEATARLVRAVRPEILLHLAAQPLVREGYRRPIETFATNVMGTVNILDALRGLGTRVAVMVTTDKVYAPVDAAAEAPHPAYVESDRLGGVDPYAASKAASEIAIECYRAAFLDAESVAVCSVRAGNVVGGGDWSAERLLPDIVRAWQAGEKLFLRHPGAVRPWQHVLEPLRAYLVLAERLWDEPALAGAYNVGPDAQDCETVAQIVEWARAVFPRGEVAMAAETPRMHEAETLRLNAGLIAARCGLRPVWSTEIAIRRAMGWYLGHGEGRSATALCDADIDAFEAAA